MIPFNMGVGSAAAGGTVDIGDNVAYSLMLDKASTQYLSRTFGTPTSNLTWTLSMWIKRGNVSAVDARALFGCSGNPGAYISSADKAVFWDQASGAEVGTTSALWRDPCAWNHYCIVSNGSAMTIYRDNTSVTTYAGTFSNLNSAIAHQIGGSTGESRYWDGYLADVIFVDGQALTPSSFGRTSADTGAWVHKDYAGTYGNNGFRLQFANSAALGTDTSGNGNNWTLNGGISSSNQYTDTPTNNYPVLNVLSPSTAARVVSVGNLKHAISSGTVSNAATSAKIPSTGKWYFEITAGTVNAGSRDAYGIVTESALASWTTGYTTFASASTARIMNGAGNKYPGNAAYGNTINNSDVVGVAVDMDNNAIYFAKNNTWQNSGDPTSGSSKTGAAFTDLSGYTFFPYIGWDSGASVSYNATLNCGQKAFTYTPPTGYSALCTANLTAPAIPKPSLQFDAALHTGNGTAIGSGGKSVSGIGFQPDLVWIKGRSGATDHAIYDAVRGTTKDIGSNLATDETTQSEGLTTFGSGGFTVGSLAKVNTNTATYVDWLWKANGAGSAGSGSGLTSITTSANTTAGVSIVAYTGHGTNGDSFNPGLGSSVPKMILIKSRTTAGTDKGWAVYHASLDSGDGTNSKYLVLNSTAVAVDVTTGDAETVFTANGSTWKSPTASAVSLGTNALVNTSGDTYIAYCFAEVEGFSKFGSHNGNSSSDGSFIYCGFRPRFILYKNTAAVSQWMMWDTARNTYNVLTNAEVLANSSNAEGTGAWGTEIDIVSTGFKFRGYNGDNFNTTALFIFAAFAELPFKYATAR